MQAPLSDPLTSVEGSPDFDFTQTPSDYFWIDYTPHNHKNKHLGHDHKLPRDTAIFRIVKQDNNTQLCTTSHGVILKRNGSYSWVFISDNKLFEANDKLRWPSIQDAKMSGDFILVQQSINDIVTRHFIIDPIAGRMIRLSDTADKNPELSIPSIRDAFKKLF